MPELNYDLVVSIFAGIALAAATGFRAFLPLLVVSLGARFGFVELNPGLDFLSTDIALTALVLAAILEISSDKIPLLDHFLDVANTFIRPIAGIVAGMAMFSQLPEPITVGMALVMGVISLGTQVGRAQARVGSTATTGGLANPVLSTAEDAISGTLSVLAVLLPILAGTLVLILLFLLWRVSQKVGRRAGRLFGRRPRSESL